MTPASPVPGLMKTLWHLREKDITGLNYGGCFNMHQMTENDGHHKHLTDTKCRSAGEQAWSWEAQAEQ